MKGTPFPGPMVALGWERLLLTGKLQERVGKPQECQRRGDGGVVGMPELRVSLCHVCGAQNPSFE